MKKNIIVFGGSNSKNSINKKLAVYSTRFIKEVNFQVIDLNDFVMPLYGIDLETEEGMPKKAVELSELFDQADGFLLSLAEHNGSYTAAFKNMFDWLSRINGKVWREKPVLLLSTSPGGRGGKSVLEAALARFPFMGAKLSGSLSVPFFQKNFSEEAGLNEEYKQTLIDLITEFEQQVQTGSLV